MSTEPWYYSILSSLLSGLVGAAVVYYFGLRQLAKQGAERGCAERSCARLKAKRNNAISVTGGR